jgi:hypothetical protein
VIVCFSSSLFIYRSMEQLNPAVKRAPQQRELPPGPHAKPLTGLYAAFR